jgi:hypothetical protein
MASSATRRQAHRAPLRRGFVVAGASVGVLFAIVLVVRLMQRPEPMDRAARTVLNAILAGDAKTLMRYAAREEREGAGLDEASLQELLDRVVLPAFSGCRVIKVERSDLDKGLLREMYYTLNVDLECPRGAGVGVSVFMSAGDRPISQALALSLVYMALNAHGKRKYPEEDAAVRRYRAWKELRPVFDSLRLQKVWLEGTLKSRALSWDELEDRLRKQAESLQS